MKFRISNDTATIPTRAYESSAGYDLYAAEGPEDYEGDWGIDGAYYDDPTAISTGIHIELMPGTVGFLRPRSSLFKRGIHVFDGTIDQDYRGEIKVMAVSMDGQPNLIKKGERLCQLVIVPILLPELELVEELGETERGEQGFGSSGR